MIFVVCTMLPSGPIGATTLIVPVNRLDDSQRIELEVTLTSYHGPCSQSSDCGNHLTKVVRLEEGAKHGEVSFPDVHPCELKDPYCRHRLSWRGPTTRFGTVMVPQVSESGTVRLAEVMLEAGTILRGAITIDGNAACRPAYLMLFHSSFPREGVIVPIAGDGTFLFVGLPRAEPVEWRVESVCPELMKRAGTLIGAAKLLVKVGRAQEVVGCLQRSGSPVQGAGVQIEYELPEGFGTGSEGFGANGCFRAVRDREARAELRIFETVDGATTERFRMLLPDVVPGESASPVDLGIIEVRGQ